MTSALALVRATARVLDDLTPSVVFVGGAVTGLLVTDEFVAEPRPTDDVDVIVEVASSLKGYHEWDAKVRAKGFENVMEGPICRYRKGPLVLDVMPTDPSVLGFANRWYGLAFQTAVEIEVEPGLAARIIHPTVFLGTKWEAFDDPRRENGGDAVASRDFADIVYVLDGRSEIVDEIAGADPELRAYLWDRFRSLLTSPDVRFEVAAHIDRDEASRRRVDAVLARIRAIAGG